MTKEKQPTTPKQMPVTLTGVISKGLSTNVIAEGNRMVVRAKLSYPCDSVCDDKKTKESRNSLITIEMWDEFGEKFIHDFNSSQTKELTITGELFQRRWTENNEYRSMHRIKVTDYKFKQKELPKKTGKFLKYKELGK